MDNRPIEHSAVAKPRFFYGYIIVVACVVISIFFMGIFFSIGVFFKPMLNEFGWSRTVTSGPIAFSWIVGGLAGIFMGRLNDKLGPRLVLTLGSLVMGAGYLLMPQIQSAWQLYIYYGVLIGAGSCMPIPLMSTVSRWFVKRRTVMMAFYMMGSGIGGVAIPPLANWLIINYGWRWACLLLGSLLLVVSLVAAQFLKRDPSEINQLPYGTDKVSEGDKGVNVRGFTTRAAINTPQFWLIAGILFFFSFGGNVIIVHLVPHMTDLEISATIAAAVLAVLNGAGIVGRMAGGFGDRLGNQRIFFIMFIMLTLVFVGLIFNSQLWGFYLIVILFGLGFGAGLTQQSPTIASLFGLKSHGSIFGLASLGVTLGGAVGTFLGGYLFDLKGSYQLTFIISGIGCLIGLVLSLVLKPVKESTNKV